MAMLTEIYIESLLVDEGVADQVREAWNKGEFSNVVATWFWWSVATNSPEAT